MLYKMAGGMRTMMKKMSLLLLVLALLSGSALAQTPENSAAEVFTMEDPRGDSYGPGEYTYPQHLSFPQELPDMLDLTAFRVINTETSTRFEFEFAQPPNLHQPWGGAGFNFHRLDLYISNGEKGSTQTFRSGAQVQFKQPWQVNLRLRDWQGGYLIHWQDHDPDDRQAGLWQEQVEGFAVFVEGFSIVAEIDHQLLEPAKPYWKYYVLVGLQDAYGPDQYRKIGEETRPWSGGGGSESQFNPNVYDILAATVASQQSQLSWEVGRLAQLLPVGPVTASSSFLRGLTIAGVVLVALGIAVFFWFYGRK